MSAPNSSAAHLLGWLASNRISGCRLPSPAWNTFAASCRSAVTARRSFSTRTPGACGDGAVHAVVVRRQPAHRREGVLRPPQQGALGLILRHHGGTGARVRGTGPNRAATSTSPRCRRSRIAGWPRRRGVAGVQRNPPTAWMARRSIISQPAGMMPAAITAPTASPAARPSKLAMITCAAAGLGSQAHRDLSDQCPACPSEPVITASRS